MLFSEFFLQERSFFVMMSETAKVIKTVDNEDYKFLSGNMYIGREFFKLI